MVTKKQAFKASLFSAAIVGGTHWLAHMIFGATESAVIKVGATVVIVTFVVAYGGMRQGKW